MESWLALNDQTMGKDRLARLVQYLSRAIWGLVEQKEFSSAFVSQFKTLEYILSSFRKLLRFGKCIEVLHSSLKAIHYQDVTIRVSLTLSKLASSLYLFADHMQWLSRSGIFRNIDAKKWTHAANKYWLLAIVMNLVRDIYDIFRLVSVKKTVKSARDLALNQPVAIHSLKSMSRLVLSGYQEMYLHKNVFVDTAKNVCDVFIPLTALGYTKFSPGVIGMLGTISSIAGLLTIIEPRFKLTPA